MAEVSDHASPCVCMAHATACCASAHAFQVVPTSGRAILAFPIDAHPTSHFAHAVSADALLALHWHTGSGLGGGRCNLGAATCATAVMMGGAGSCA